MRSAWRSCWARPAWCCAGRKRGEQDARIDGAALSELERLRPCRPCRRDRRHRRHPVPRSWRTTPLSRSPSPPWAASGSSLPPPSPSPSRAAPMIVANLAWDLARHSRGRFVLGLGSQVRAHNERRFSVPWIAPAARMAEYVEALRAIWRCWEDGQEAGFPGQALHLHADDAGVLAEEARPADDPGDDRRRRPAHAEGRRAALRRCASARLQHPQIHGGRGPPRPAAGTRRRRQILREFRGHRRRLRRHRPPTRRRSPRPPRRSATASPSTAPPRNTAACSTSTA